MPQMGEAQARDWGPLWAVSMGLTSQARFTSADASGAAADVTNAPASGKKLCILDVTVSVDTAMRVDLKEETAGTVFQSWYMAANSVFQFTPRGKWKLNTADKKLQVQTSAAGNVSISVTYYSEK